MENKRLSVFLTLLLFSGFAFSADTGTMFVSFSKSAGQLISFVNKFSIIGGIFLCVNSIFKFAELAKKPGQPLRIPIVMFFSGVGLFVFSSSIDVIGNTLALGPSPGAILAPTASGGDATQAAKGVVAAVMRFIQLIGVIAVCRGFFLLNKAGINPDQNGVAKPLTHLFGGVFAIHIQDTLKVLANTFGFSSPF